MAGPPELLLLLLVFSPTLLGIRGDAGVEVDAEEQRSPQRPELDQLRSKIAALESSIVQGNLQSKAKEETLLQFENVIREKSEIIDSLHAQIESLQKNGATYAAEQVKVGKAHAQTAELEKQIDKLKSDIQAQRRKSDALEARAVAAEKKVEDLNLMLENIHGAWLPPWLSAHLGHCQSTAVARWNKHGKPAYDAFMQKVLQISAQAQKVEPHLEAAKDKWIPTLKDHWVTVRTSIEPYAQLVSTKTVEVYETSVTTIRPHIVRIQDTADPYFQDAKKLCKPYIDQVATSTKPHVEKMQAILKPYTEQVSYASGKFFKSAMTYHHQVQSAAKEVLKKYELTKDLATKELVWFAASAFLAMPIFLVYWLFASMVCQKSRSTQKTHGNHASRRRKHRHADK